ncbi:MAG: thioredoxin [Clostridia bacterium]|jgi:thioredoxin 1|nr:thioredoxin [Clostridia bacterium]
MKKKISIIISIITIVLIVVAISTFFIRKRDKESELEKNQEVIKQKESIREVTSENFEEVLQSGKTVVVDFYATWCQPCQKLFPIVEDVAEENKKVKFVKVDIDKAKDIAEKYKITSVPTLVLIQDGKEKDRITSANDKIQILEFIEGK